MKNNLNNKDNKISDLKKNIPLIGICRGMQVINAFFGGGIETLENSKHVGDPHFVSLNKNIAESYFWHFDCI